MAVAVVLLRWGDARGFHRGSLYLVSSVGTNSDGSLNAVFLPVNDVVSLVPGTTTISPPLQPNGYLLHSQITANDYVYIRLHAVEVDEFGDCIATVITAARSFNQAGLGAPVYR